MQIVSAFGQVQSALSFFVSAYTSIADWKAVLNRLSGFEASIDWAEGLDGPRREWSSSTDGGKALLRRGACRRAAQRPGDRAARRNFRSSRASGCW